MESQVSQGDPHLTPSCQDDRNTARDGFSDSHKPSYKQPNCTLMDIRIPRVHVVNQRALNLGRPPRYVFPRVNHPAAQQYPIQQRSPVDPGDTTEQDPEIQQVCQELRQLRQLVLVYIAPVNNNNDHGWRRTEAKHYQLNQPRWSTRV